MAVSVVPHRDAFPAYAALSPQAALPAPSGGRTLVHPSIGTRLLRHVDEAMRQPSLTTMAAMRASLTDLVDELRALDLPLERVIATVEGMLRDHWNALSLAGPAMPALAAAFPIWCTRAYRCDDWW